MLGLVMLAVSTGFTLTRHYCGNDLVSMAVDSMPKSCCETGGCCHNETSFVHLQEDYVAPASPELKASPVLDLFFLTELSFVTIEPLAEAYTDVFIPESPPPVSMQTVLSLLQTYLC